MAALYVIGFLSSLGFSVVIPFLVYLVTDFGGNGFVLGAIGAGYWAAQLVGAPWLGSLSDRLGRKRVLFRSQVGAATAWAIFLVALLVPPLVLAGVESAPTGAFTLTLPLVLITLSRMTDGLFNGSISVANAYLSDLTSDRDRRIPFARLGAATNLGFVGGPVLAGLLTQAKGGVHVVVIIALVSSVVAAALVQFLLPNVQPQPRTPLEVMRTGGVRAHKLLGGGCPESVRAPRRHALAILRIRELRPMVALYFLVFLGFSILTATLPIHAARDAGWSSARLGVFFTTLALILVITQTLVLPKLAKKISDPVLGAIGAALLVFAYVALTSSRDVPLFAGALLYGVGNGVMWPSYLAMLARSGPPHLQGTVQGVGSGAGSLASIIGTLSGGVMYETIGAAALYVSAGALALAALLFAIQGVPHAGRRVERREAREPAPGAARRRRRARLARRAVSPGAADSRAGRRRRRRARARPARLHVSSRAAA